MCFPYLLCIYDIYNHNVPSRTVSAILLATAVRPRRLGAPRSHPMSWTVQPRGLAVSVGLALAAALGFPAPSDAAPQQPVPSHDRTPAAVYRSACQGCHGPDGRGMPQSTTAFRCPCRTSPTATSPRASPTATGWRSSTRAGLRGVRPAHAGLRGGPHRGGSGTGARPRPHVLRGQEGVAGRQPESAPDALHREGLRRRRGGRHGVDRRGRRPEYREQDRVREAVLLEGPVRAGRAARLQQPEGQDWTTGLGDVVLGWKQVLSTA